jgi:hypothetical protein
MVACDGVIRNDVVPLAGKGLARAVAWHASAPLSGEFSRSHILRFGNEQGEIRVLWRGPRLVSGRHQRGDTGWSTHDEGTEDGGRE